MWAPTWYLKDNASVSGLFYVIKMAAMNIDQAHSFSWIDVPQACIFNGPYIHIRNSFTVITHCGANLSC